MVAHLILSILRSISSEQQLHNLVVALQCGE
jgi:hypothetical protein